MSRLAEVATLKGAPVLGLWPALARDVLDVLERVRATAGDLVRLATPGGPPLLVVKHPRDIRRVLVENAANDGRTPFHDRLKIALGDGLLNSEGALWTRQRRRLQPLFHPRALDDYGAMMAARSRALAEETLRLYPPVPWFARRLLAADRLADVEVPAGAIVMVSPWLTQRDDRWWPQPLAFRLARFAHDAPKPAAMTYFPFVAGLRTCIGMGLQGWR